MCILPTTDHIMYTCNKNWRIVVIQTVRQPHQTSDMFPNFKLILCILENVDDLASKCKNNYGDAAKIRKVMKDYVHKE